MTTKDIKTQKDLIIELSNLEKSGYWVFRGQRESSWELKTSIERMISDQNLSFKDAVEIEISILKRFQRESNNYNISGLDYQNIPDWLSLMQHYGAPTRLLDWTHSPWVALFFAIIESPKSNSKIWGLNWNELSKKTHPEINNLFNKDNNLTNIDDFSSALKKGPGIIKLNSYRQNQRQVIQQGTFIIPLDVRVSFIDNLKLTLVKDDLISIEIDHSWRLELLQKLYRMNITYATLYPGIEGFSKSLKHLYVIPDLLKVEKNIQTNGYNGWKQKFS